MQESCPALQAVYRGEGFRSACKGYLHALVQLDSKCCSQQPISQLPAVAPLNYSPRERFPCEQPGGQSTPEHLPRPAPAIRRVRVTSLPLARLEFWDGFVHHGVASFPLLPQNMRHLGSQMCGAALLEPVLQGCLGLGCGF